MIRSPVIRIALAIITSVVHGLVWYLIVLYEKPLGVPEYWKTQTFFLITVSLILALLIYLFSTDWLAKTSFTLRALIALIIIPSIPEKLAIAVPLLSVLLLEIFVATSIRVGFFASVLILILLTFQRYQFNITWDYAHQYPKILDFFIPWSECIIGITGGWVFRYLVNQNNTLALQVEQLRKSNIRLVEANVGLQDYTIRAQRESIINERNRISREIHDSVGYILTNLITVLDYTRELIIAKNNLALSKLDSCREQARAALTDVRRAVKALRPPVEVSHLQAISTLVTAFSETTGIEVSFHIAELQDKLNEEYQWLIYRVIQEALTNTVRHGQANQVMIHIHVKNKNLEIIIRDNGLGSTDVNLGCGLTGIQERAKTLGGRFEVETAPGKGFTIKILLPLTQS